MIQSTEFKIDFIYDDNPLIADQAVVGRIYNEHYNFVVSGKDLEDCFNQIAKKIKAQNEYEIGKEC